ncbi:hypothetical protein ACFE04_014028 [Oxalis oulophora]
MNCKQGETSSKGLAGVNHSLLGSSNEGDVTLGVSNVHGVAIQVSQQQQQGSVIRWDRFLPIRSLKVLLVENDDSTRQVVNALLHNCSYQVTAVSNALQAWKILEDLTNQIDLILCEVVMPVLSGFGLLCKIMAHKTLKSIPVIMMSSHDSLGIVFKCLSKGAVDFLVKPIRKNELKNLWQHVWRRCHSSSGSGSESGSHSKISEKSKRNYESGNHSSSSDEHDNGSNGLSNQDANESDNGSGTQSSWTKKPAKHDSHQSPTLQLDDSPDSTCAQVIHTKPETSSNGWVHVTETKECLEQNKHQDNAAVAKDLKAGESRNPNLSSHLSGRKRINLFDKEINPFEMLQLNDSENCKLDLTPNVSTVIANTSNPQPKNVDFAVANGPCNASQVKDKVCQDTREILSLELTLKRLNRNVANDDRNALRHSDLSAFSKYNTSSSAGQGPTGIVGSRSPFDNSSVAVKTETKQNKLCFNATPLNQQSKGTSNNNDMGSTAKYVNPKTKSFHDKSETVSTFKPFHSPQNGHVLLPSSEQVSNDYEPDEDVAHNGQQVQVHHHHHHHHHYHHHVHNKKQRSQLAGPDDPPCGSSNVLGGKTDGIGANVGNYIMNGSGSGSNHGSNGQNESSNVLNNNGLTNMESDMGAAGNTGVNGGTTGRAGADGSGVDEDWAAQREAVLIKFRQKRKERCFEKRVRYQSRKKLAEQRPRVKGQFVRQKMPDNCRSSDLVSDDNSCDSAR